MKKKGKANAVDHIIAANMRRLREKHGFTQTEMGEYLDMQYQQIQKYERAIDRISASNLWILSQAMNVPMREFFKEIKQ